MSSLVVGGNTSRVLLGDEINCNPFLKDFQGLLWLKHKVSPKACALKAWFPAGGAIERCLDHEGPNHINLLMSSQLKGQLRGGA
jgi:peptidase E